MAFTKKTVRDIDVDGKRVLVRVDFNVPIKDGVVGDTTRIQAALPTINYLVEHNARVILMSHLGRPDGTGFQAEFSLEPVAAKLAELSGLDVTFVDDTYGEKAAAAVEALEPGKVLVLENVRFDKREKKNDPANLSERVLRLKALFDGAGIRYQIRPDMLLAIWEKFACNVSENQVAAVLDLPYGAWGSCEDAEALRIMVAAEVIEIAQKKGIPIETNYARDHLDVIKAVPPRNKPSTLQDILAGRKTEVDIFAGAVIRLGKEYGVPTPYNEFLYHAIRVLEAKNAGTVEGV